MKVRKVAKQLKRWYKESSLDIDKDLPVIDYRMGSQDDKTSYIMRMTRKHYFGLRNKYPVGSMMWNYYTHQANSYYLYEDILEFWNMSEYF
jgi:hypothetical protein